MAPTVPLSVLKNTPKKKGTWILMKDGYFACRNPIIKINTNPQIEQKSDFSTDPTYIDEGMKYTENAREPYRKIRGVQRVEAIM